MDALTLLSYGVVGFLIAPVLVLVLASRFDGEVISVSAGCLQVQSARCAGRRVGSPWRFVRGDSLRVLNAATILQKVRADLQTLLNMTLPTLSNQFDQTTLAVIERALLGPSGVHWVVAILVDLRDSF